MEAFMKQAKKLSESVAKQQQAVFKQFVGGQSGPLPSDTIIIDEAELERHKQLERLYGATKSAKHFQREVLKGIEGIIGASLKHIETVARLSEECRKYSSDSGGGAGTVLGRAALHFGSAHSAIERERDLMDRALGTQVGDPLKAMVTGAPLEDARNLTQRYDRMRQEAETLVVEIYKRGQKERDGMGNPENSAKLQIAESKMSDLASAMTVLGKEAVAAMSAVEAQQQRQTLQRLIGMVETERAFHAGAASILEKLHSQLVAERQHPDVSGRGSGGQQYTPPPMQPQAQPAAGASNPFASDPSPPPSYDDSMKGPGEASGPAGGGAQSQPGGYFLAEVMHTFAAEGPGELNLTAGDYVVVRQVGPNGWSEGECKGQAGWFPTAFVEAREKVPARKIADW